MHRVCPDVFPGGDTKVEALNNIKEAIELYIEPVEDDLICGANNEVMEVAI